MLNSMFQALKRLLLAFAGGLGSLVVGGMLSLLLLHLKVTFAFGMSSLGLIQLRASSSFEFGHPFPLWMA